MQVDEGAVGVSAAPQAPLARDGEAGVRARAVDLRGLSRRLPLALSPIDGALLALAAATLLSTLLAPLLLGASLSPRDGYEVAKLGLYWALFRVGLAGGATPTGRRMAFVALCAAGVLSVLVGAAQYVDAGGIAARIGGWWAPAQHLRALERDGRAFGTVGNPNYFGALMALLATMGVCAWPVSRRSVPAVHPPAFGSRPLRAVVVLAVAGGALGVVLSGSRGALAMLIAATTVLSGLGLVRGIPRRPLATGLLLLAAAFVAAVVLVEAFPRGRQDYLTRVGGALSPTADGDLALRIERWRGFLGRRPGTAGDAGNYLANGGAEQGDGGRAAGFRALPGTVYARAPEAALLGAEGIIFRGNPAAPARRAAVYQQQHIGRQGGAVFVASVWVKLLPPVRGAVDLYVNVYYADGERRDPLARVTADPARAGDWQRLTLPITTETGRVIDFIGVYLLSDDFSGEAWADGFELVDGAPTATSGAEAAAAPGLDAGARFRRSPLFGAGPGKAAGDAVVDNEYLLVAARYGVMGLIAYLALWGCVLVTALRRSRAYPLALGIAAVVAGFLIFNLVAGSLYHLQLMGVFWPLAGAMLAREGGGG